MKPDIDWIKDWRIGVDPPAEKEISEGLLSLFIKFWVEESLEAKSKTTINRYRASLHALGGYIVENAMSENRVESNAKELALECIESDGGPLVYRDNEAWQDEFDMVCRKLYKFMHKKC